MELEEKRSISLRDKILPAVVAAVALLLALAVVMIIYVLFIKGSDTNSLQFNAFAGIVSSFVWTVILIAVYAAVRVASAFQRRRDVAHFFGLGPGPARVTIFVSSIQVQRNGTVALESVNPGYFGAAVSRLEYQAAHAIRALVTKKPLSPIESDGPEGILGKYIYNFEHAVVDIKVSPLPDDIVPKDPKTGASEPKPIVNMKVGNDATIVESPTASSKSISGALPEVSVVLRPAQGEEETTHPVAVLSSANPGTEISINPCGATVSSDKDTPQKDVVHLWDDIKNRVEFGRRNCQIATA